MTTQRPGLILGYTPQPDAKRKYWQYRGHEPLFTTAPPRKGKSTGAIWPNLIMHDGSAVLNDCQLEHARDFARYRSEVLGQTSLVHDSFRRVDPADLPRRADGKPFRATFNPIDLLRLSPTPVPDAKMMAAAWMPAGNEKPFFVNGGRNTLAAWMVFVALDPLWIYPRTMGQVWNVLNLLPEEFATLLAIMTTSTICGGFCAREAKRYLAGDKETVQNIISTVHSACGILDDPEIIESMASTSPEYGFGPLLERVQRAEDAARALADSPDDPELQRGAADTAEDAAKARQESSTAGFGLLQSKPMSVFFCLPGEYQNSHSRYSRLMLSCVLTGIERPGRPAHDNDRPRTVIFFDEAFSLGAMDQFLTSLSRMPAYVTMWYFYQDLNQLRSLYPQAWETFISSAGVVQAFGGAPDQFTAEYLSKKTGQRTAPTTGQTESTRADAGIGTNHGSSGRPCLYPDEIQTLDPEPIKDPKQILFYAGQRYKLTNRLRHWADFPDYMRFLARQMKERTQEAAE